MPLVRCALHCIAIGWLLYIYIYILLLLFPNDHLMYSGYVASFPVILRSRADSCSEDGALVNAINIVQVGPHKLPAKLTADGNLFFLGGGQVCHRITVCTYGVVCTRVKVPF